METIRIPGIDLDIPRVGLGCWAIGGWMWGGTPADEAVATIRDAIDRGLRLLDTAPVYGFGRSEEIVGRALREHGRRDEVVVATKLGLQWKGEAVSRNSAPKRVRQEVEESLRRLGTDVIDILQVHWPDSRTPLAQTAETLHRLLEEGTIRAIGVSNFSVAQMDEFRKGGPLHTAQPPYNLYERAIDEDVLPYCRREGIRMLGYGTICRGLLSGRLDERRAFEGDDLRQEDPKFQSPRFGRYLEATRRLDALARERHGQGVLQLAVRWVLDRGVDVALWGARRPEQLHELDGVFGWALSEEDMATIDAIVADCVDEPVGPEFMAPPL